MPERIDVPVEKIAKIVLNAKPKKIPVLVEEKILKIIVTDNRQISLQFDARIKKLSAGPVDYPAELGALVNWSDPDVRQA